MLTTGTILCLAIGYLLLLFGIAYYADRRADQKRSIISNPYIYSLSLAVYCTAWTFYGSVGHAAHTGFAFLPVYIGPTLAALAGGIVIRKILRISKVHRITSIADFVGSRYGKSALIGGLVTVIAVLGIVPYIALQLKAIAYSFQILRWYPQFPSPMDLPHIPFYTDTAFFIALLLALFSILFGTRHLDATERHEGLVAAIAFESLVKLVAFVLVGGVVAFGLHKGVASIFQSAEANPQLKSLLTIHAPGGAYLAWSLHILLSMFAVLFLPRQFQVLVVENVNENHLDKAVWLFPAYLLLINLFVLPIAFGGILHFGNVPSIEADYFVLTLPLANGYHNLALLVFIGGLSAATGMVIVETLALATMICNDLVMPLLLRWPPEYFRKQKDLSRVLLAIRRISIVFVLLLGYAYYSSFAGFQALVSIGLTSFAAVAQFAPAILGGLFWKQGSRTGVIAGLTLGIFVWGYTLVVPTVVQAGLLPAELLSQGPWGISLLRPDNLFGLSLKLYPGDMIAQGLFWSLTLNTILYVAVSLFSRPTAIEHTQAMLFVDIFKYGVTRHKSPFWKGTASIPDLKSILVRFLGTERTNEALSAYAQDHQINWHHDLRADPGLVTFTEKLLAGAIGAASAHVMVASVVKEEPLGLAEVMNILDETRQVIAYSHELERTSLELKAANEQLQELDRLKDEFISTVTHELKTPLTSVSALAEILLDTPSIEPAQRKEFARIIVSESKRLTRLINRVLAFQKLETGTMSLDLAPVDIGILIQEATTTHAQMIAEKGIELKIELPSEPAVVAADRDRIMQVILNFVSNAVKFCPEADGRILIRVIRSDQELRVEIADNGRGIAPEDHGAIFEKFHQLRSTGRGRPRGTGLGLAIARQIIEVHGGAIGVESEPHQGATFFFTLITGEQDSSAGTPQAQTGNPNT